jgi:hypothetical protein
LPVVTMPSRGRGASITISSRRLARAKASAAYTLWRCSRYSWSIGASGQRMLRPPGGISKSSGSAIATRPGSTVTEAELSSVSATAFIATQVPA